MPKELLGLFCTPLPVSVMTAAAAAAMVAAGTVLTWRALRTAFLHTSASLKDQLPLFEEVLGLSLALLPCAVRRMPRLCSGCKNLHSAWNLHQPLLLQWRHTIV